MQAFYMPLSHSFFALLEDVLNNIQNFTIGSARENIIKALDGFNTAIELF